MRLQNDYRVCGGKRGTAGMKTKAVRKAAIKDLAPEQWRELRRESLGGSDAAVIVGLNPWKSKIELYCDKKGMLEEVEETEAIRLGNDLEEYVAKRFSEATGKQVRRSGYMWQHPKHSFITANIDREIVGENAFLECKTTSPFNKSDFNGGEVPLNYYVQCMHYLAVTGCERAYLAVLVFSKGFYWYTIERNEEEIKSLMRAECDFWEKHISADIPPVADGSEGSMEALSRIYPDRTDMAADIEDYGEDVRRYLDINKLERKLAGEKDEIKGRLASALGECLRGECENAVVSYTPQTKTSVDTRRLKAEYPEIYSAVSKTTAYNVLRIKERKNA
ncbi:MAG: YqaJ viral recombinase family protein [Clostridia bacterium]